MLLYKHVHPVAQRLFFFYAGPVAVVGQVPQVGDEVFYVASEDHVSAVGGYSFKIASLKASREKALAYAASPD